MASDWWSNKIGKAPAPAPARYVPGMPTAPVPHPVYTAPQQMQPQVVAPQDTKALEQQVIQALAKGEIEFTEAAAYWTGGEGMAKETTRCPQCHGDHYFSRTSNMNSRMPAPAPECFDCGFNGMFQQDPNAPQARN